MSEAAIALKKRISDKKTALCVAVDVTKADELISIASSLGPYICLLKTHIDILEDFSHTVIEKLQSIAKKEEFYIFEDRKFADIGQTTLSQYTKGIYRISSWAHFTNAHPIVGSKTLHAMKTQTTNDIRGLFLISDMSHLKEYHWDKVREYSLNLALEHSDFISGFITQKKICGDPRFLHITPGVHLEKSKDNTGQHWRTPTQALHVDGCDVIIVGRGITASDNIKSTAQRYLEACKPSFV